MRASTSALQQIESDLKAARLPPLIQYDILLELERAPKEGLRLFELEEKLLLKQYGVSRLVDRMVKAGHLAKQKSNEDARGYQVTITEAGKRLRSEIWKTYRPSIDRAVGNKLSYEDARQLNLILDKLI